MAAPVAFPQQCSRYRILETPIAGGVVSVSLAEEHSLLLSDETLRRQMRPFFRVSLARMDNERRLDLRRAARLRHAGRS
jgi:hypothetical protein